MHLQNFKTRKQCKSVKMTHPQLSLERQYLVLSFTPVLQNSLTPGHHGYASQSSSSSAAGCCGAGRGGITSDILANAPPELAGASVESAPPGTLPEIPVRYSQPNVSASPQIETLNLMSWTVMILNKIRIAN